MVQDVFLGRDQSRPDVATNLPAELAFFGRLALGSWWVIQQFPFRAFSAEARSIALTTPCGSTRRYRRKLPIHYHSKVYMKKKADGQAKIGGVLVCLGVSSCFIGTCVVFGLFGTFDASIKLYPSDIILLGRGQQTAILSPRS